MKKAISILLLVLVLTVGMVYAVEDETGSDVVWNENGEEKENVPDDEISPDQDAEATQENTDEVVSSTEEEIETNFVSKEYDIDGKDKDNYLVEGGNENAINTLATKQHDANGTVIENVNVSGLPYDLTMLSDEEKEQMKGLELRQFISFETKSGKVFHLIIDHSKSTDNVQMLTEVGEQDLLNLIEGNAEVELILNEVDTEDVEKETKKKTISISSDKDPGVQTDVPQPNMNLIIIIGASIVAGIAGWYFKIYKPKKEMVFDDEVDEADYIDEGDAINEDEEIS